MPTRLDAPDRRRRQRGTSDGEPPRRQLVSMIVGTYREMPGLCLGLREAARLFGLRSSTCHVVLDDLAHAGTLRRTTDGQYIAAALEAPPMIDHRPAARVAQFRRVS